ncbi:MAG: hypothetical protein GAK30_01837 [Paracidovorax wautersii]|uniref:Extracellular solute-binding protein, family 5 Middle n=1 Tax=Paracidovorax wautersii TaxID=1177982 RepID=A0A7V8FP90_9BURK|nr:MAG: hypothetical protein GAK30_01837 [Paracidovorax wautersii]
MRDRHLSLDHLTRPAESHRVMDALRRGTTRRDLLALLAAGGMQATLAGGLAGVAFSAHAQATATPKRGGRIRVAAATAAVSDTFDPAKQSNQSDYVRCNMVYNGLTALDGSLTPQPALAESFTTADARTWVFTLRQGVTFHGQGAGAGRRGVFHPAPQGPGHRVQGQDAG